MNLSRIRTSVITCLTLAVLFAPRPAASQLVPRPWVSVGVKEDEATFAVGAKAIGLGVELGSGPNGATGVDVRTR